MLTLSVVLCAQAVYYRAYRQQRASPYALVGCVLTMALAAIGTVLVIAGLFEWLDLVRVFFLLILARSTHTDS